MTSESNCSDGESRDTVSPQIEPAPRWVKIFGAVIVALLLVFVVMHLAGGGFRGHGA
jgi:hypothetical protein